MPPVGFAPSALRDWDRLREFLRLRSPAAARRAGEVIVQAVRVLGLQPRLGRPIEGMPEEFRGWAIDLGDSGYVARYRVDDHGVTVLAVRH